MIAVPETRYLPTSLLRAGHFREKSRYAVWRTRGTPSWLLIYTVAGGGRFGARGNDFPARAGQLTLLRPETPHDYGIDAAIGSWDLLWVHFHARPHWLPWLAWREASKGLMQLTIEKPSDRRVLAGRIADVVRLASSGVQRRHELAMHALEHVLLLSDELNPQSVVQKLDPRIQTALDFAHTRLADPIQVADVAKASSLSPSRLTHLFRDQVGVSVQRFIEDQRLDRARQLLEQTQRSIESIGREVGFKNAFYFSTRFKKRVGASPRAYRERIATHSL